MALDPRAIRRPAAGDPDVLGVAGRDPLAGPVTLGHALARCSIEDRWAHEHEAGPVVTVPATMVGSVLVALVGCHAVARQALPRRIGHDVGPVGDDGAHPRDDGAPARNDGAAAKIGRLRRRRRQEHGKGQDQRGQPSHHDCRSTAVRRRLFMSGPGPHQEPIRVRTASHMSSAQRA